MWASEMGRRSWSPVSRSFLTLEINGGLPVRGRHALPQRAVGGDVGRRHSELRQVPSVLLGKEVKYKSQLTIRSRNVDLIFFSYYYYSRIDGVEKTENFGNLDLSEEKKIMGDSVHDPANDPIWFGTGRRKTWKIILPKKSMIQISYPRPRPEVLSCRWVMIMRSMIMIFRGYNLLGFRVFPCSSQSAMISTAVIRDGKMETSWKKFNLPNENREPSSHMNYDHEKQWVMKSYNFSGFWV